MTNKPFATFSQQINLWPLILHVPPTPPPQTPKLLQYLDNTADGLISHVPHHLLITINPSTTHLLLYSFSFCIGSFLIECRSTVSCFCSETAAFDFSFYDRCLISKKVICTFLMAAQTKVEWPIIYIGSNCINRSLRGLPYMRGLSKC